MGGCVGVSRPGFRETEAAKFGSVGTLHSNHSPRKGVLSLEAHLC